MSGPSMTTNPPVELLESILATLDDAEGTGSVSAFPNFD